MPHIFLYTNLAAHKLDIQFRNGLIELMAKTLKMPTNDIWLAVHAGAEYCQRGIEDADAAHQAKILLNVKAIWHMGPRENVGHSNTISNFIRNQLGIPLENIVIHFEELKEHEIGYKGTTVAVIKEEEARNNECLTEIHKFTKPL